MSTSTMPMSPVQEAEKARQTVRVLTRMESRFAAGRWERGVRFSPTGGNCLIGAVDEASRWVMPGVEREVSAQLAKRLPSALQPIARVRPRLALALYNDVRGRRRAVELVSRTREELGGLPPQPVIDVTDRAVTEATSQRAWTAQAAPPR
jgi:hypothetical protein